MSRDGPNTFTVMSVRSCVQMQEIVEREFDKGKYVVFSWKSGNTSSMGQKALIHIWFRQWMAVIGKKKEKDVGEEEIEAIKRKIKALYYHATAAEFMIVRLRDPMHPDKEVIEYSSIGKWTPGECFSVMEWMQLKAAEQNIILESKGEFQNNKRQGIQ